MKKWFVSIAALSLCFLLAAGCKSNAPVVSQPKELTEKVESSVPKQVQETTVPPGVISASSTSMTSQENTNSNPKSTPPAQQEVSSSVDTAPGVQSKEPPVQKSEPKERIAAGADQVKDKYNAQLMQAKEHYLGQLQTLYNQAIAAKKSGKSNKEVYNTFSQQAITLQEDSQAQVNQILLQMKNELLKQNLPTDSVNDLRSAFYSEMDKAKENMIEKAKSQLGS